MIHRLRHIKEIMFGTKWKYNKKGLLAVRLFGGQDKQGFTIVEILVVITVFVTAFVSILGFFVLDIGLSDKNKMRLKAISLSEEGIEAVRFVRDNNLWVSTLAVFNLGTDYHPIISSSSWNIVSGSENINGFTRTIIFNAVSRDASDNIENIYNPSNNDPNTRKITVTVSWVGRGGPASESLSTYLTNWK